MKMCSPPETIKPLPGVWVGQMPCHWVKGFEVSSKPLLPYRVFHWIRQRVICTQDQIGEFIVIRSL